MKVLEFLKISTRMLEVMTNSGIYRDDWRYVKAYEQYVCMRHNRVKHSAAVRDLSEELGVSERTLERAFKRLKGDCKIPDWERGV